MDLEKIRKIIPSIINELQKNDITAQEWEKMSAFIDREYDTTKRKSILPQRDKDTFQNLIKNLL